MFEGRNLNQQKPKTVSVVQQTLLWIQEKRVNDSFIFFLLSCFSDVSSQCLSEAVSGTCVCSIALVTSFLTRDCRSFLVVFPSLSFLDFVTEAGGKDFLTETKLSCFYDLIRETRSRGK